MAEDIVQVEFEFELPGKKWLARFSKAHPDLTFKILSMSPVDNESGNTILEVDGPNVGKFLDDFRVNMPDIACTVLHEDRDIVMLNVKSPSAILFKIFMEMNVPVHYPIIVKRGRAFITITAERQQVDQLLTKIEDDDVIPVISRIGRFTMKSLLKPRQDAILRAGLEANFFGIPRGIDLVNLAGKVGLSPSALSEQLRRIFKILARNYLATHL